jgi:hypothetical protein
MSGGGGVFLYDQKGRRVPSLVVNGIGDPDILLFDAKQRIRADLKLDTDGSPSLDLSDPRQTRAVLGSIYLKNTSTGSTEHRSPRSLALFKEDGKLLWSTP